MASGRRSSLKCRSGPNSSNGWHNEQTRPGDNNIREEENNMKLYWSWSLNPQKVRLALNELGLAHEIAELKLLQGEQRRPAHLALNPNGKVPVLQDGDLTLWESNAILVYLDEKEGRLWPTSTTSRGE